MNTSPSPGGNNDDSSIREPGAEVRVHSDPSADAAAALASNIGYRHWGINE